MHVKVQVSIDKPRADVWRVITDIENSVHTISGIEKIEVLQRPEEGLVGFEWMETRTMFGREATETMWVTEVEDERYYKVRAESHGALYLSTMSVRETGRGTELTMDFGAIPTTVGAKLMTATIGRLFVGTTRKALQKDLDDIKAALESQAA